MTDNNDTNDTNDTKQKTDAELGAQSAEEAAQGAKQAADRADQVTPTSTPEEVADHAVADHAAAAAAAVDADEPYRYDALAARKSEPVEEMTVEEVKPGDVIPHIPLDAGVVGVAAFFDHPHHLMYAASKTRDSDYSLFEAYSPFPIHGMDDAMGLGRSWIPWVTFGAGLTGTATATGLQFGIMGFDWPMIFQGKPFIAWPSFIPIMFELTVLFAGVTTGVVMLAAAGCFRRNLVIDPQISNDRFVLWISADDERFEREGVIDFMRGLNPTEIRTIKKEA